MKKMRLYQKLKEEDLVENLKEFNELIWLREIRVNGEIVDNPNHELNDSDKDIKVGIFSL